MSSETLETLTPSATCLGYVCMMAVALQVGLQPLVTRKCVDDVVSAKSLVLAENAVTAAMSLTTLALTVPGAFSGWRLIDSFYIAGPPAIVYAIRSLCKLGAYRVCDGVTFNIINQTKTVFCAISAWLLLNEGQSFQQCTALMCAVAAGALLILPGRQAKVDGNTTTAKDNQAEKSAPKDSASMTMKKTDSDVSLESDREPTAAMSAWATGVTLAVATAACSGLAAALSQMAFRTAGGRPSALFTFELALWGAPMAILLGGNGGGCAGKECPQPSEKWQLATAVSSALRGWRLRTITPVALQAAGGILVGYVVKQRGGVAMGLCTIVGIAVSAIADSFVNRKPPSVRQTFAAALAASSIVAHQAGV